MVAKAGVDGVSMTLHDGSKLVELWLSMKTSPHTPAPMRLMAAAGWRL